MLAELAAVGECILGIMNIYIQRHMNNILLDKNKNIKT
ncbi:hypothetical protein PCH70_20870 [Pseudomonas cichorii JBC1]|nr:hypothetical protein PCH70_20870 [Pseudomonas cichorii JBC1]